MPAYKKVPQIRRATRTPEGLYDGTSRAGVVRVAPLGLETAGCSETLGSRLRRSAQGWRRLARWASVRAVGRGGCGSPRTTAGAGESLSWVRKFRRRRLWSAVPPTATRVGGNGPEGPFCERVEFGGCNLTA